MPNLPTGTVTFAFSDIEGSTALLKQLGDEAYTELLTAHRRLLRETFAAHDGQEIDTQGDAFFYSFRRARDAVAAAVGVQRAHEAATWPAGASVRLRLGLHTGEPAVGDEGYTGLDVVRAARIAAVGHGGQVLISDSTRAIVAGDLPDGVELVSLGEQRLKDIDRPEPLHELRIPGVTSTEEPMVPAAPGIDLGSIPGVPPGVSGWVRDALVPIGNRARETIEKRVLAELESAFESGRHERPPRPPRRPRGPRTAPPTPPASRSVADEIARLSELRQSGALTDEQYARAVDRVVTGGESDARPR